MKEKGKEIVGGWKIGNGDREASTMMAKTKTIIRKGSKQDEIWEITNNKSFRFA